MDFGHITDLLMEKLNAWSDTAVQMLPNLIVALVVLVIFYFLGRAMRMGAERLMRRVGTTSSVRQLLSRVAQFAVLAAGLMIALSVLKLENAVTSLLAGAGVAGLAIGFAFQDMAANFMAGVGLSFRRPFQIGDLVETNDETGFCERIHLRSTELRTADGRLVIIPNKDIFQSPLVNHSHHKRRRVDLEGGVSYDDDLEKVASLVRAACEEVPQRLDDRDVQVYFTGFGNSSIDFVARFWVPYDKQADYLEAQSDAIVRIKRSFDENGVTIPFPIRTLDFGIRGGKELAEVLPEVNLGSAA